MKTSVSALLFLSCALIGSAVQAQDERLTVIADSLHRTFVSIDTHNDASDRKSVV
jgi:hypothetical protein